MEVRRGRRRCSVESEGREAGMGMREGGGKGEGRREWMMG